MPLKERRPIPLPIVVHGAPCSVGQLYRDNQNDTAEIDELDSVLFREGNTAQSAWTILHAAGYTKVAHQTVNKHRGGNCRCFKIDRDLWCLKCYRDHAHCGCA